MQIIPRQRALAEGLRFYFTGRPCKRGHVTKRYTYNSQCLGCQKTHQKDHRKTSTYARSRRQRYERVYRDDPARFLHDRARGRARRRGVHFDLTVQDIRDVWPADGRCPVFGEPLIPNIGEEGNVGKALPYSPSLDRINVSKGYVRGNVAVVSQLANSIKAYATSPTQLRQVADWMETVTKDVDERVEAFEQMGDILHLKDEMGLKIGW